MNICWLTSAHNYSEKSARKMHILLIMHDKKMTINIAYVDTRLLFAPPIKISGYAPGCQEVSHAKRQRIPILNHCNQSLQQDQCNFAKTEYDDIISIATLQEEECSSNCFRKFYSRRKSRWWQSRTLRGPGDP